MDSLDKFKRRMRMSGVSATDSVVKRSKRVLDNKFSTSPSYAVVNIDGEEVETIVHRTNQYNIKQIHFKYDYEVQVGSVINYEKQNYLLMEADRDVLNSFGKMERCNSIFNVQVGEPIKKEVGRDERGRPVYKYDIEYKENPCIIRDKYYSSNENAQLPLPEGKLDIFIKYQEAPNLVVNYEFDIKNKPYKIADISYVDVIEGVGVMRIHAERREDKSE